MIQYKLPIDVEIDGKVYKFRNKADYRQILDIIEILKDEELPENEKYFNALLYFYEEMPKDTDTALKYLMWFIACGNEEQQSNEQPTMSWEKDFDIIASAINKNNMEDIRAVPYMHWWTFIGKYMEIGESVFSTVVSIREKKRKGEQLEKWEQDFYFHNKNRVDL